MRLAWIVTSKQKTQSKRLQNNMKNNSTKTVKLDTKSAKANAKAKAIASKRAVKKARKVTYASKIKLDGTIEQVALGYKAAKNVANADYQICGSGFANVRQCGIGVSSKRVIGQETVITKQNGFGWITGKITQNDAKTITVQHGNLIVRLDKKIVLQVCKTFADAVKYVFAKGETGIVKSKRIKCLDSGDQYLIASSGKMDVAFNGRKGLLKINRDRGTGQHDKYSMSCFNKQVA